jgi:N-acyl-phosphatidylethanolamine-hydrolysing phospholipase D
MERPESPIAQAHLAHDGRYTNPWLEQDPPPGGLAMLRWSWERFRHGVPPDPDPARIPRATAAPAVPYLRAVDGGPEAAGAGAGEAGGEAADRARVTWIGHASFLVQLPGINILTDPVFSERASPFRRVGPRRFLPPGLALDALPPIDVVLLSHDHYDHLDARSVARLRVRYGDALTWLTPLGYGRWFARRGVRRVVELDWWDEASVEPRPGSAIRVTALPAQHWTRRGLRDTRRRLWCSWAVATSSYAFMFCGDSGYGPGFAEIGARHGPIDLALLPIGAYEPRWFMASSHMTPEEAARAAIDVGARAVVGSHWGTFRLTDEDPLEPPVRMRAAWNALGLPVSALHIPAVGETLSF